MGWTTDREPERHVAHYEGRVFAIERGGVRRRVGRIAVRRCLLGKVSARVLLGADLELVTYGALFGRGGRLLDPVARKPGDLLVLDRLGLIPEYRGSDLGLEIIREATRQVGPGCAVVALIPAAMNYDHVTGAFTRATDPLGRQKLERHYRRLGFQKLGDVMYFDLRRSMTLAGHRAPGRRAAPATPPRTFRRNSYIVV